MPIAVKNKVALVTGANRGIGKAIVETFIRQGAKKVYLAVRNPASTKELKEAYGDKVMTLQADLADAASIERLASDAKDVDIVVNNAGILIPATALSADAEAAFSKELDVNVFGLLRVANAFADTLEANKGAFVQLNSVASIKNFSGFATYCASKAAAYSLTQALRNDFAKRGVSVLSVHPGPIATDMAKNAGFDDAPAASVVADGIVEALAAGEFHLFPDDMAKDFEAAYKSFSDAIVMADLSE